MDLSTIKLVIWDLDETLWDGILSENTARMSASRIQLIHDMVDCGVMCSICSKNDHDVVKNYLEAQGIYCVNDIYGKYYTNTEGSLMTDSPHQKSKHRSAFYRDIIYVNEYFDDLCYGKSVAYFISDISRRAILTGESYKSVVKRLNTPLKKILVTLFPK